MQKQENVEKLVEEYSALLTALNDTTNESIVHTLVRQGDWTPKAAVHLLQLSKEYGSFMLRNALALSLAMDVEDGELGF